MSVKKINGYKILLTQTLGSGAYGQVLPSFYLGLQRLTRWYERTMCNQDHRQAKKYLNHNLVGADPYLKSALLSEIQILSKIKSTNVVGFFDVLESKHNYYIVQELCDNDLEKVLKSSPEQKLTEEQAISYLIEICNGFLSLVREGIVHRYSQYN